MANVLPPKGLICGANRGGPYELPTKNSHPRPGDDKTGQNGTKFRIVNTPCVKPLPSYDE